MVRITQVFTLDEFELISKPRDRDHGPTQFREGLRELVRDECSVSQSDGLFREYPISFMVCAPPNQLPQIVDKFCEIARRYDAPYRPGSTFTEIPPKI